MNTEPPAALAGDHFAGEGRKEGWIGRGRVGWAGWAARGGDGVGGGGGATLGAIRASSPGVRFLESGLTQASPCPQLAAAPPPPDAMAALGRDWTLVLDEHGALHACGRGSDGQLGLGSREDQRHPARVDAERHGPHGDSPVVLVAAGECHWAAVTQDGAVLTCGRGGEGQLGCGDAEDQLRPARLGRAVFAGVPVVLVACGYYHTLAVTGAGRVYTSGDNSSGQLGHGNRTSTQEFVQVDPRQFGNARVVMAAAGVRHSVAATAEGGVFTWGDGLDGRLGHNDEQDRLAPGRLAREQFGRAKVVLVAAGGLHTVALTEGGVLWVWGYGFFGQLGLGDFNKRLVPTRLGVGEAFGGSLVRMAACGRFHTLAVTVDGAVWAWGHARYGKLGLNHVHWTFRPARVDQGHFGGARVAVVLAGGDHCRPA